MAKAFVERARAIAETSGGKYRRVWLLRHFPIKDETHESGKTYLELTSTKRDTLTPEQKKWAEEKDATIRVDTEDPKTLAVIGSMMRTVGSGQKVTVFSDNDETAKVRNKESFHRI